MSDHSTNLPIARVVDPTMLTLHLGVETMFSTGNNVQILLHKLHYRSISGLVVVLEIAPNDLTDIRYRN